ncbi:MAG: PRC-barrel domain-containing protein [Candidatus Bathyarchaeia archaeon]
MAKQQKEKSVTKDKLIGMTVIDAEGNIVGTVKDVGFTIGKAGISLSVEDKEGEMHDIAWDRIQGAGDFIVLKPTVAETVAVAQPMQTVQTPTQTQPLCPTCRGPLSYIQQYQRWYCYKCQKYA